MPRYTRSFRGARFLGACAGAALALTVSGAAFADVVFLSRQGTPVEEQTRMRQLVLPGFTADAVEFLPEEPAPFHTRIEAEAESGKVSVGLIGGLHGDFAPHVERLDSVDDIMADLKAAGLDVSPLFSKLGKLGTDKQMYVPWMQASYIMAANKKALSYLPAGADINALTYDQLIEWGKNIEAATGQRKLGFPVGPKGLMARFLEGYAYPSFTNSAVTKFRSAEAEKMWGKIKDLWQYAHPQSTNYAFMQEPLLSDEVWVAWDHTSRLMDAFNQRPDDFIAFPAPAGPKGRSFMAVVAGIGIPKGTPDRAKSATLISYLTQPETQVKTLRAMGFFPVVETTLPDDLPAGVQIAGDAVRKQAAAADAIATLLPVGMGDKGGHFNKVFTDAFQLIVLRGADIRKTLDDQAAAMRDLMAETGAPCWAPDPSSAGACPVE